jgi:hypothetical protein
MRRTTILALTACLLATGCIGAVAQGTPAKEHRGTADDEAYAVDDGAELIEVSGVEASESWSGEEGRQSGWSDNRSIQDDRVGDGSPPLWVYEYRTDNATVEVVVDRDGEVVAVDREDEVDEDEPAIDDWEISSLDAVEIVQENNGSWAIDDEGMAVYDLDRDNATADPVWTLVQMDEDDGFLWARVNATNGEYLGSGSFDSDWSMDGWNGSWSGNGSWNGSWSSGDESPYQEGGSFGGNLTVAEPSETHTFEVKQRGHPELGVELTLDQPATSTVTATIEGPTTELGTLKATADDSGAVDWWDRPRAGDYTVTVELQDGAAQTYDIQWCAEGESYESEGPYGPDEIDVCERVDGERR